MECNPDDVTEAFCDQLHTLPINRISMGAQTFSDERLRFLRRRHRARDVADAVARLRKAGIQNISIDLMFGFPEETLQEWKSDIEQALALNVEHLSAYSLMYEEGTPLYHLLEQGRVTEMDEELYRQMYDALIEHLTAAGYEHYEISNFARPGHRSHHNSSYWADVPYIGLGAAAHSYNVKTRSWNCENLDAYIQGINNGRLPSESEEIDETTHYNDLIITALRTREGLSLRKLTQNQRSYVMKTLEKKNYLQRLRLENDRLSLTREGIYVSDSIMADLMWPTPENI